MILLVWGEVGLGQNFHNQCGTYCLLETPSSVTCVFPPRTRLRLLQLSQVEEAESQVFLKANKSTWGGAYPTGEFEHIHLSYIYSEGWAQIFLDPLPEVIKLISKTKNQNCS